MKEVKSLPIPYLDPRNWEWYHQLKVVGLEKVAKQIACLEKHKRIAGK